MPARPRAANDAAASDTPADAARVVPLPRPSDTALVRGDLRLGGRLDARFFALLRAVQDTGSLQKAARAAGYSYKGAWLLLESAGNLARSPLVERATGGRGGGGSVLTPAALQLLAAWQQLQIRHAGFLREQEAWLLDQPGLSALLRSVSMKTTARNQFAGTVSALQSGPATTHVTLGIGGGHEITAALSTASARRLGLAVGSARHAGAAACRPARPAMATRGGPRTTATCRASPASRPATSTTSCSTSARAGARRRDGGACSTR
jgi:molybdate transport repressor ModE-like protein/molybdopterin-binding protein